MASSHAIEKDPTSRYARVRYLLIIAFILFVGFFDRSSWRSYFSVWWSAGERSLQDCVCISLRLIPVGILLVCYWILCYLIVERGQVQSLWRSRWNRGCMEQDQRGGRCADAAAVGEVVLGGSLAQDLEARQCHQAVQLLDRWYHSHCQHDHRVVHLREFEAVQFSYFPTLVLFIVLPHSFLGLGWIVFLDILYLVCWMWFFDRDKCLNRSESHIYIEIVSWFWSGRCNWGVCPGYLRSNVGFFSSVQMWVFFLLFKWGFFFFCSNVGYFSSVIDFLNLKWTKPFAFFFSWAKLAEFSP